MEVVTVAKIKIIPDETQKDLMIKTMHAYIKACDFVADHIFKNHILTRKTIHDALYYQIRKDFDLPSQMSESVFNTVIAAYKTIRENNKKWIKPKFNKPQIDLVFNRDYSLVQDKLSINTLSGRIKLNYISKNVFTDGKFGTAKIVFKHDKFFIHIPVTRIVEDYDEDKTVNIVGHDRGLRFVVTSYDSKGKTSFVDGNFIKQKRAHYKALRTSLQKKHTASSRRRLKAIGHKENRWMNDINHQISKALVTSNPKATLHVLEDLSDVRNATERVKVKDRYYTVSWPYYDLEQKLIYKANIAGQKVIKVNPAYTSQTCPKCGHISKESRIKKIHTFKCVNCGYTSNDDRIAAMNLYRKGIEYLIKSQESMSFKSGSQSAGPDAASACE